ncbi:hypothetical protein AU194_24985 [Mycobacterium sp. GA-2829]|nr:hypothetical protein AU194_24985 [Mycobacterium sp. GA-2829]
MSIPRHKTAVTHTYMVTDRLHRQSPVRVSADGVMPTVAGWLAELGVHASPLVGELGRTVRAGDWPATHAIADQLSVDVAGAG